MPDTRVLNFDVSLMRYDERLHLDQLRTWLIRPHVIRWWGDPPVVLKELAESQAARALIVVDSQPVGFLCWQRPTAEEMEQAGLGDLPTGLIDIDIFIGEPDLLGLGLGPRALALLVEKLHAEHCPLVGLGTSVDNQRALRAYEKVGFRHYREFEEEGQRMVYLVRTTSDP